ncbi:MAG: hypothetical protein HXX09_12835 [Bacteroidetes bacterium]|nr:hypothetical protein [Bacteroidota bacterium]
MEIYSPRQKSVPQKTNKVIEDLKIKESNNSHGNLKFVYPENQSAEVMKTKFYNRLKAFFEYEDRN